MPFLLIQLQSLLCNCISDNNKSIVYFNHLFSFEISFKIFLQMNALNDAVAHH